jgi:hypothetical protein
MLAGHAGHLPHHAYAYRSSHCCYKCSAATTVCYCSSGALSTAGPATEIHATSLLLPPTCIHPEKEPTDIVFVKLKSCHNSW